MASLFGRLRERKLAQWTVAYLGAAWVVLEVVGRLAEIWGWPPFVDRAVFLVLLGGLATTLIVAWFHGERGEQRVGGLEVGLLGAVLLATGTAAVVFATGAEAGAGAENETESARPSQLRDGWIAVLPFRAATADSQSRVFSDGITHEVTTALNRIGDLQVIAPGSAMPFRDRAETALPEIAATLGVGLLLDGQVRVGGGAVRVSAQLVDGSTGRQLWAESYGGELSPERLFDIQADIGANIADALHASHRVADRRRPDLPPTRDLDAYNAYVRGLYFFNQGGAQALGPSIEQYERAVDLDPEFALAHAGLAEAWLASAHFGRPPHAAFPEGIDHALMALDHDPGLAEAHIVLADSRFHYEWDWEGAERGFRRGIELGPTHSTAHWWFGGLLAALGRFDEAVGQAELAIEMDPISPLGHAFYGRILYWARRFEEAAAMGERASDLSPGAPAPLAWLGITRLAQGRVEQGVELVERAAAIARPAFVAELGYAYAVAERTAEAREIVAELEAAERYVPSYRLAWILTALGETERALEALDRAAEARDADLIWANVDPIFDPLRGEPRFRRLILEMGLEATPAAALGAETAAASRQ